jgi:hypothetical protein
MSPNTTFDGEDNVGDMLYALFDGTAARRHKSSKSRN